MRFLTYEQLSEARADELVAGANRDNPFTPLRAEYVGMSFRLKALRFRVGRYRQQVVIPDLRVVSRMKGTDEEKVSVAMGGDVKVNCTCLVGTTKIKLLNGQDVEIRDLPVGESVWIYASDENGDFAPALGRSLGVTKHVGQTLRVTLDNGEVIECTPDHLFRMRDGSYVEAQHLEVDASLMPLYSELDGKGYERVKMNSTGKFLPTHSVVNRAANDEQFRAKLKWRSEVGERCLVTHHKDSNKRNNIPTNLEWMGVREHWMYHAGLGTQRLAKTWEWARDPANAEVLREKMVKAAIASQEAHSEFHLENLQRGYREWVDSGDGRKFYSDHFKKNCFAALDPEGAATAMRERSNAQWADPAFREGKSKAQSEYMKRQWKEDPSIAARSSAIITELNKSKAHQASCVRGRVFGVFRRMELAGVELSESNFKLHKSRTSPHPTKVFASFEEALVQYRTHNHRVLRIEMVTHETPVAVYDLNVPTYENFALSAGVFVHNCPDFLYGGFKYIGTQLDYSAFREDRPPVVRNPDEEGTVCKHLKHLLARIDDYASDVAADLARSREDGYTAINRSDD